MVLQEDGGSVSLQQRDASAVPLVVAAEAGVWPHVWRGPEGGGRAGLPAGPARVFEVLGGTYPGASVDV